MFLKKSLVFTLSVFSSAFLSACISPDPEEHLLGVNDDGSIVACRTGDTIRITLDGNPTTGYVWQQISQDESEMLILKSSGTLAPESDPNQPILCGAPSETYFVYKVIAPGKGGIRLGYLRPWMKNVPPDRTFEILVTAEGEPDGGTPAFNEEDKKTMRGSDGVVKDLPPGIFD